MIKPEITVIIPVYNLELYIERCLESICNQQFENIEILVIDDGSSDSTGRLIKKMAEIDRRIKYIYQENKGVSVARNKGIKLSTGKYIMFVDGDDYIQNTMIAQMYKNKKNSDMIISKLDIESTTEKYINTQSKEDVIKDLINGKIQQSACGILYNANIIKENNIFFKSNMKYGEDFIFTLEYILSIENLVTRLNEKFYMIENRENSASRTYKIDMYFNIKKMCELLYKIFDEKNILYIYYKEIQNFLIRNIDMIVACIVNSNYDIKKKQEYLYTIKKDKILRNYYNISVKQKFIGREIFKLKLFYFSPKLYLFIYYIFNKEVKV